MRNLLRIAAACALTLNALSTVEASTYGTCRVRCYQSGSFPTVVSFGTTYDECCRGDVSQYCPAGWSGAAVSFNNNRCGV